MYGAYYSMMWQNDKLNFAQNKNKKDKSKLTLHIGAAKIAPSQ